MSRILVALSACTAVFAGSARADAPNVAVDIAPVHSLVARVMQGVGVPNLVVPPGASPHGYSLRPSEAQSLQDADLVFWIGADLTPWMEDAVETLAADAVITTLLELDETTRLDLREDALFEAHDHGDHDDHAHDHNDHDHDEAKHEHDDHDHADAKDDHGHDDHDHEGHAHGDHDPHAWLSTENAATWLNVIAAQLSAADPDNAGAYFANAAAAREDLATLNTEINDILDPVRGGKFVAFHDAYQYFEVAFDFPASGAIALSDATDPSPARIEEIQSRVKDERISCVLSEPQFNPGLVAVVMDGTDAKTAVLDPLGSDLQPGPELYSQLLRNLATSLSGCLS